VVVLRLTAPLVPEQKCSREPHTRNCKMAPVAECSARTVVGVMLCCGRPTRAHTRARCRRRQAIHTQWASTSPRAALGVTTQASVALPGKSRPTGITIVTEILIRLIEQVTRHTPHSQTQWWVGLVGAASGIEPPRWSQRPTSLLHLLRVALPCFARCFLGGACGCAKA
jgi:hypothetical protein